MEIQKTVITEFSPEHATVELTISTQADLTTAPEYILIKLRVQSDPNPHLAELERVVTCPGSSAH
jgi:hypothetical protein